MRQTHLTPKCVFWVRRVFCACQLDPVLPLHGSVFLCSRCGRTSCWGVWEWSPLCLIISRLALSTFALWTLVHTHFRVISPSCASRLMRLSLCNIPFVSSYFPCSEVHFVRYSHMSLLLFLVDVCYCVSFSPLPYSPVSHRQVKLSVTIWHYLNQKT